MNVETTLKSSDYLAEHQSTPVWARVPRAGERDPICGFGKTKICELILPSPANGFRPPVKSISVKRRGATRGVRLWHVPSMLEFLANLLAEQGTNAPSKQNEELIK